MSAIFGTKFTSLQPYASSEAKMMKICGFFDPATHIFLLSLGFPTFVEHCLQRSGRQRARFEAQLSKSDDRDIEKESELF
ncbi:hypothetical protein E4U15_002600 [Claviceps sp. LM218 group G6]|nr:hypothetical protein E4U15_002600 [Claviceps sp. LM218 group G6]